MSAAGLLIELRVGRSPAVRYKQTKLRAAAFGGYSDLDRDGFALSVDLLALTRFEIDELIAIIWAALGWKHTTVGVAGRPISRFEFSSVLRCWRARRDASPRKQAKHCELPPGDKRTVAEEYRPPCKCYLAAPVRWADHAPGGVTDHAAMQAAMIVTAAAHPAAWCPAFSVESALVQIRSLPASRDRTRAREQRKREKLEAEWQARRADLLQKMRELVELEEAAAWLAMMAERIEGRGVQTCTREEWDRLADATGLRELRELADLATMTAARTTARVAARRRGSGERSRLTRVA